MFIRCARGIRWLASVMASREPLFIAAAAPLLIFPNRFTGFAAALLIVLWLARWLTLGYLTRRTRLDFPIALILFMTVIGMLVSVDLSVSWPHFWGIVLGVTIYYGLVNGLHNERDIQRMGVVLLGFGTAAALLSMPVTDWQSYQFYNLTWITNHIPTLHTLAGAIPTGGLPSPESGLAHPRPIGGAMGLLLPVALSLLSFGHGRVIRCAAAVAALVMGFTLVLSQALSALAGTAVAVVLLVLWRYRWLLWVTAPAAMLGAVLSAGMMTWVMSPGNKVGDGITERLVLWLWSLEALRNEPFTGVGLFNLDYTLSGLFPLSAISGVNHAHNFFLQVALDIGVPGLLAFLWLLLALGLAIKTGVHKAIDANTRSLLVGVGAGVVSYMIFGLEDSPTLGTKPGVAFWVMLGLVGALSSRVDPLLSSSPTGGLRKTAVAAALLLGVLSAVLFVPGVRGMAYLNLGTLQAHKSLAESLGEGRLPEQLMRSAIGNLTQALLDGQGTVHAYDLLASLYGRLGECAQTVDYMRRSVMSGGVQPLGGGALLKTAFFLEAGAVTTPTPEDLAATTRAVQLQAGMGLQRTPEALYQRLYYHVIKIPGFVVTRWGPWSSWWEPYLQLAILANEQIHDPQAAAQILQFGMERATFKESISCYRVDTS